MAQLLLAAGACITTPSKKRGGQTVLMTSLQRGDKYFQFYECSVTEIKRVGQNAYAKCETVRLRFSI